MAAGNLLKEGTYIDKPLTDDEMWSAFAYLFSSKSVNDTSYKFGFLKSILDNLYNVDDKLMLTYDQLFSKFAEIYWNLVLKHHIRQKNPGKLNRQSELESALIYGKEKYGMQSLSLMRRSVNSATFPKKTTLSSPASWTPASSFPTRSQVLIQWVPSMRLR